MKKQKQSRYIEDENGVLKRRGFLSWFHNFFYYYKSYVIVAVVFVAFCVALYFSMGSTRPDMYMYVVSEFDIPEQALNTFYDNVNLYIDDIDDDSVKYLEAGRIILSPEPETQSQRDQYMLLKDVLEDREVVCLTVDGFTYDYLMEQDALRSLDFFGIESPEPYRIRLNDTALFDGVDIDEDMYLVMKYIDETEYEEYFTSLMASLVVDMVNGINPDAAPAE